MGERKEYFLSVYIPSTCFKGEHKKNEFINNSNLYTLREIDQFTSNFNCKKKLLFYLIDRICKDKENISGNNMKLQEVVQEYKDRMMNMDYCVAIGKYDKKQKKDVYTYDIVLSNYYELVELNKGNRLPMKKMIINSACDNNFVKNIVDRYMKTVISDIQLANQFSFLNLDKNKKNELINNIMQLVNNDEIDKEKLTKILEEKFNSRDALNRNINVILSKHKRMNGLRKKVEILDESLSKGDPFAEYIDFSTDMTKEFTKYSSCRKIYFFTKHYVERVEEKNKIKRK